MSNTKQEATRHREIHIVRMSEATPAPASINGKPIPGLLRRDGPFNRNIHLVEHTMAAGSDFPWHQHVHDQLAYLKSGHIRVSYRSATGEVNEFEAKSGDSFVLSGGIEHKVHALEESVALDIFTPFREDYLPPDVTLADE